MRHNIVVGKFIVDEVVNRRFVGLNRGPYFDVLSHDRLDVIQRYALYRERADLASVVGAFHQRNDRPFLAFNPRHASLATLTGSNLRVVRTPSPPTSRHLFRCDRRPAEYFGALVAAD